MVTGVTEEQYLAAMAQYAMSDNVEERTTAKMDEEIIKVREKYAGVLQMAAADKVNQAAIIMAYCTENKATLFAKTKTLENAHGKVGFRTGTPKLVLLGKKVNWDMVLERVKELLPGYVRKTEEVDKEGLIRDRTEQTVMPHLEEIGVKVTQGVKFFIELKKEEVPE